MNLQAFKNKLLNLAEKFEQVKFIQAVRRGFIFMIPIIMVYSFSSVILSIPIPAYQSWLQSQNIRFIFDIVTLLNSATTSYFSILLVFSISWSYAEILNIKNGKSFIPFAACASFLLILGVSNENFDISYLGAPGTFSAILSAVVSVKLFDKINRLNILKIKDSDNSFILNKMIISIFPIAIILILFALLSYIVFALSGGSLQNILADLLYKFFQLIGVHKLIQGIVYMLMIQSLWFFGVHGTYLLYQVNDVYLNDLLNLNIQAMSNGFVPHEIVNTVFLNSFVNIGGCGATLALVIIFLVINKKKENVHKISKFGFIPSLFNINEIITYGVPVIFNPIFCIPFLIAPVVNLVVSYFSTIIGFIPVITQNVNWACPIFVSGYLSTQSINGVILQIALIVIDILIYIPFVNLYNSKKELEELFTESDIENIKTLKEAEHDRIRLINSLSDMYYAVFELNLESEQCVKVKIKDEYDDFDVINDFFNYVEGFIKENIPQDEQKDLLELLNKKNFIRALIEHDGILEIEYQCNYKGSNIWNRAGYILSEIRDDKPYMVTVTIRNVSDIKVEQEAHNQALKDAYEMARNANNAKTDFLSSMSHDIRTPMNAIMGMTVIAKNNKDNVEKLEDCLDKIETSSNHLLDLINDVLDMSKIESGKVTLNEEPLDLDSIIDDVLNIILPTARDKHITVKLNKEINHAFVQGDVLRINQIFLNILSNAVKFTPKNGNIQIFIREITPEYKNYISYEFKFIDNGIGMSEEFKDKIFTPFARSEESVIKNVEGTGLGMSIVKNIVDMMNGEIYVKSKINKGSEFTVILHLKSQDDIKNKTVKEDKIENKNYDFKGKKILLVEDNKLNMDIASEIIGYTGADIEKAENGKEALEKYLINKENYYDLIIMDIRMPIMNGYEATEKIRNSGRDDSETVPIIAMTADAFSDDIRKTKEAGMNAHITKPFDINKLMSVMNEMIK
ncbi:PTS transporter subunit EIIC [Anaerofustis stercorihominis]|uniref:PTS transporter subunit EIIC n=1 Tax=Anaerofustis stercorihominis TaxID=214853 RepID=UPI0039910B49